MAADRELLQCAEAGAQSPVLRLYGWREPTLSLGYFQKPEEALHLDLCRARGIAVVLESRIQRTKQGGYGSFSPARPVPCERSGGAKTPGVARKSRNSLKIE